MNITSFSTNCEVDRMTNIDSSSTAHLTMNAAGSSSCGKPSARASNNSDSDLERSPSVTVLKPTTGSSPFVKHHNNHHHLNANGCTFSNQHASNHLNPFKSFSWSRRSTLEKTLIFFSILTTICLLLLTSSINILISSNFENSLEASLLRKYNNSIFVLDKNGGDKADQAGEWIYTKCSESKTKNYCITPNCVKVASSVIEAIDTKVDPCDDFYMYSCGDWIKSNPLPDGKTNWGTFSKLWQDNQAIMRTVLESTNFTIGSAEEKAKIYYDSCLDRNDTVESRGAKPMQDLVDSAGGWAMSKQFDPKSWSLQESLQIYHNQYNRGGLFTWAVGADERNSTRNIIQLDQGGLGLPSRDYYLNKTDKLVLDAYMSYMTKVMELMGGESAKVEEEMHNLYEFERRMAEITVPQDQRRDDERMYHKFTLRELTKRAPFLNWTKYFDEAYDYHSRTTITFASKIKSRVGKLSTGMINENDLKQHNLYNLQPTQHGRNFTDLMQKFRITDDEFIVIYSPEYFEDLSNLVGEYMKTDRGKTTLANYLAWTVFQSLVATLPKQFRDASKQLRKALIGSEGTEVSWRYCVTDTNQLMGFALGSLFVRRVFQGRSKERAEEMIYNIRNAFKENLGNLQWMDDRTRHLAREKADHINQMIGFPDFILSPEILNEKYEGLELDENEYFENNIKVNILALRENMDKINKPANKTEWEMTPPMVNAYYTPTKNQIVFPAGILQTPFYDLSFPNSLNYGAMGVVMGHELTHAFDDQGREYDKDGNLYQWWYNETLKNFEERVKCFVNQYSSYKVDDNYLNGRQTLGENIADNGGLKAAFRAYEKWSETHEEPNLPGLNLTSKQLFFVGFAQVWCSINTPEAQKLQVLNDPHAPAQFRVVGTLSNSEEFAREFNCPIGSKMNPDKKCIVW